MTFTDRKWRHACVTFTQRSRKRYTGYLIKELVNERALCDSHTKLSQTVPLGN